MAKSKTTKTQKLTDDIAGHVKRWLGRFKSADGIRRFCRKHGARGVMGDSSLCVLARVIRKKFAKARIDVQVTERIAILSRSEWPRAFVVDMTYECHDFVRYFDLGLYPELAGRGRTK